MVKKIPFLYFPIFCSSLYGIAIDGFSSLANDRFANDISFEGNAYDFSGVGRTSNSRWATLVSRNVILSANHFQPNQSGTVTFYETNDPTGNSVTINVKSGSGQRIGDSDLWIAVLEEAVPANYATYSFATENITSTSELASSPYALNNAFLLGRSPSNFDSLTDVAVGRNRLDAWLDDVTAAGTTDDGLLAVDNTTGGVEFESILEVGDSGAPVFVDVGDGELTIVGTNWFTVNLGAVDANGFAYVGNYDTEISNFIDANPIPELKCSSLILGILSLSIIFQRRSNRQQVKQN